MTRRSIKKAEKLGYIVKTNLQAHIINGIESLEKEFLENKLVDKMNIKGNSKLGEIPSISFPNIFLQQQFLITVIFVQIHVIINDLRSTQPHVLIQIFILINFVINLPYFAEIFFHCSLRLN